MSATARARAGSGQRALVALGINGAGQDAALVYRGRVGPVRRRSHRPGAPLFPTERLKANTGARRLGPDTLRAALADATRGHLPGWDGKLTPHVLRHYCASQLYLNGMDLIAIQEALGHAWVATTMRYVHVHRDHVEQAWTAAVQRAERRLEGLI